MIFIVPLAHNKVIIIVKYYAFVVNLLALCNITLKAMENLLGKEGG
jgi:hypothetical protein